MNFDTAVILAAGLGTRMRPLTLTTPKPLLPLTGRPILAHVLEYLADAQMAGIVLGARVPIILTSRADGTLARLGSCAIALLLTRHKPRAQP